MKKVLFNFRVAPPLLEKITQLAEQNHDGDKTAMITNLILLGIEALKQGAEVPVRQESSDIPSDIALTVDYRIREMGNSLLSVFNGKMKEIEGRLEILERNKKR